MFSDSSPRSARFSSSPTVSLNENFGLRPKVITRLRALSRGVVLEADFDDLISIAQDFRRKNDVPDDVSDSPSSVFDAKRADLLYKNLKVGTVFVLQSSSESSVLRLRVMQDVSHVHASIPVCDDAGKQYFIKYHSPTLFLVCSLVPQPEKSWILAVTKLYELQGIQDNDRLQRVMHFIDTVEAASGISDSVVRAEANGDFTFFEDRRNEILKMDDRVAKVDAIHDLRRVIAQERSHVAALIKDITIFANDNPYALHTDFFEHVLEDGDPAWRALSRAARQRIKSALVTYLFKRDAIAYYAHFYPRRPHALLSKISNIPVHKLRGKITFTCSGMSLCFIIFNPQTYRLLAGQSGSWGTALPQSHIPALTGCITVANGTQPAEELPITIEHERIHQEQGLIMDHLVPFQSTPAQERLLRAQREILAFMESGDFYDETSAALTAKGGAYDFYKKDRRAARFPYEHKVVRQGWTAHRRRVRKAVDQAFAFPPDRHYELSITPLRFWSKIPQD